MLDALGTARIASGPQRPWVKDACASLSRSKTRRPALASVPPMWWQLLVLPTPPLALTRANVMAMPKLPPWVWSTVDRREVLSAWSTVDHRDFSHRFGRGQGGGPPWTGPRPWYRVGSFHGGTGPSCGRDDSLKIDAEEPADDAA